MKIKLKVSLYAADYKDTITAFYQKSCSIHLDAYSIWDARALMRFSITENDCPFEDSFKDTTSHRVIRRVR